jgi:F-type H+-transporting ATPase subunit c
MAKNLKVLLLLFLVAGAYTGAFAELSHEDANNLSKAIFYGGLAIGAGVAIGAAAGGGGAGLGSAVQGVIEGMARNPNMGPKLLTTMFIGMALIETFVLYGFLIAIIFMFTGIYDGRAGFHF